MMKHLAYIVLLMTLMSAVVTPHRASDSTFSVSTPEEKHTNKDDHDKTNAKIRQLIQENKISDGLSLALKMHDDALFSHDNYGLFESYKSLSELYLERRDFESARNYCEKAIEIEQFLPTRQSLGSVYVRLYQCGLRRYPTDEESLQILLMAKETSLTIEDLFESNIFLAMYYGQLENMGEYVKYRNRYHELQTEKLIKSKGSLYYRAESYYYIMNNDLDSAIIMRRQISDSPDERNRALFSTYRRFRQFDKALIYASRVDSVTQLRIADRNNLSTADIENMIDKSYLDHTLAEQNMHISEIQAQQQREAMERLLMEAEASKRQLLQEHLVRVKREHERKLKVNDYVIQVRATEARRKAKINEAQVMNQERKATMLRLALFCGCLVLLIGIAVFAIMWSQNSRKLVKRIKHIHAQQKTAHDATIKASANKDNFIHNMSKDIRIPLSEVQRYSLLLSSDSDTLTPEQRMQYGTIIQENSTIVTDYVNSILNSSHHDGNLEGDGSDVSNGSNVESSVQDNATKSGLRSLFFVCCITLVFAAISSATNGPMLSTSAQSDTSTVSFTDDNSDQNHYDALLKEIEQYINNYNTVKAIQVANSINSQAEEAEDPYGLYQYYTGMSMICDIREDPKGVENWCKKAIAIAPKINQPKNLTHHYLSLFQHTRGASRSDVGQAILDKAERECLTPTDYAAVWIERAYSAGERNDTAQYTYYINKYDSISRLHAIKEYTRVTRSPIMHSYGYIFRNQPDSAIMCIKAAQSAIPRYKYLISTCRRLGRAEEALDYRDSLTQARLDVQKLMNTNDINSLNELKGNNLSRKAITLRNHEMLRLQMERESEEYSKRQMKLKQEQQDMVISKLEQENEAKKDSLKIINLKLAHRKEEIRIAEIAAHEREHKAEQHTMQMFYFLIVFAIVALILVIVMTMSWYIRNSRYAKRILRLTRQLHNDRLEAVNAMKMKDMFVQNMSHEIRTPLNAVTGFAQLLALPADLFPPEERKQFAGHIRHNIQLLTMLIDDILHIGNIEKGNYQVTFAECSVNEQARMALSTVEYRVSANIHMQFTSDVPDDFTVHTDGQRVQQILINYLTNAIKHTKEGSISLHISHKGDNIEFSVADTGSGIPKDQATNIFERFVKLNDFVQGTGLGLNICRILSEKLNGHCALDTDYPDNTPGVEHGARFIFTCPVKSSLQED